MLHTISKFFALSGIVLLVAACTKHSDSFSEQIVEPISFYDGNVLVTIRGGAPISTRSSNGLILLFQDKLKIRLKQSILKIFPRKMVFL